MPGRRTNPRGRGWWLLVTVAALATTVPAGAANREHQQMMADIRMLQEQTQQLQLMLAQLADAVKSVNTRLDTQGEAQRKAFADQKLLMDNVAGDLRVLREKIDDTNVRLSSMAQEIDAIRATAAQPAVAPLVAPPTDGTAPAGPPAPEVGPPAPNAAAGLSPQRLYDQAYADFASGQWTLAITGFDTFLKTFPRSDQADKAQWYIGESYLLDGKFDQAVAAYDRVIGNYPSSPQAPLAYYKRGSALAQMGQMDRARESWETVVKKYPDSDAAILARQRLNQRR